MNSIARRTAQAAVVASTVLAVAFSTSNAAMADGDGDCTDRGNLCVFDGGGSSGAHYDLYDNHKSLAGFHWFGGGSGDVNNDISSVDVRGAYTSCNGYYLYQYTNYSSSGWRVGVSKDVDKVSLVGTQYNNAASSFKKAC